MKKILLYSDSPAATTGLGRLWRALIGPISKEFEIHIVGMNHNQFAMNSNGTAPIFDTKKYPIASLTGNPWWLSRDVQNIEVMKDVLRNNDFDIILTSTDMNVIANFGEDIVKASMRTGAKWVNYTPIDRLYLLDEEMGIFDMPDHIVTMSDFGTKKLLEKRPSMKDKITRIYHPVVEEDFPEVSEEELKSFREQYFIPTFKKGEIISNIGRNMFRKDHSRALMVMSEILKWRNRTKYYMHCQYKTNYANLANVILALGMSMEQIDFPKYQDEGEGVTQDTMNKIYRSSHVIISTSQGEGFGYHAPEAFLTGVPLIVPDNTTMTEFIGENEERGYLVPCTDYNFNYGYGSAIREEASIPEFVNRIKYVLKNYDDALEKSFKAQKWVKEQMNLDIISKQWLTLLNSL